MAKRTIVYLVIALNFLDVAILSFFALFNPSHHPSPIADVRSELEASSNLEDLRSRALLIMSAREASDRAIADLHEALTHLIRIGLVSSTINLLLLCFLVARPLRA
jgi:hypothetical protein